MNSRLHMPVFDCYGNQMLVHYAAIRGGSESILEVLLQSFYVRLFFLQIGLDQ